MTMTITRTRCKGTSTVEFALVSVIMFFVLFAIFEFGRYMFVEHTMRYAAQDGARAALVGGTESAINTAITTAAKMAVAPATLTPPTLTTYIYPISAATVPPYSDPSNWASYSSFDPGAPGDYRKLRIRYKFSFVLPFIKSLFPSGLTVIDTSVLYRIETF